MLMKWRKDIYLATYEDIFTWFCEWCVQFLLRIQVGFPWSSFAGVPGCSSRLTALSLTSVPRKGMHLACVKITWCLWSRNKGNLIMRFNLKKEDKNHALRVWRFQIAFLSRCGCFNVSLQYTKMASWKITIFNRRYWDTSSNGCISIVMSLVFWDSGAPSTFHPSSCRQKKGVRIWPLSFHGYEISDVSVPLKTRIRCQSCVKVSSTSEDSPINVQKFGSR